jgi:hypothetical protein
MSDIENSDLLEGVLKALYTTAARRTTQNFAVAIIETIIRTIEERYEFLKYVQIYTDGGSEDFINVSSDLNSIHPAKIGKAIEAIVQVVYMDLEEKAGLYFIKEVKINAGEKIISKLREYGVDLELLMLQQYYLLRRQERKKTKTGHDVKVKAGKQSLDNVSLLGYSMKNVESWSYDTKKKVCVIYDKAGKELDRLNLDTIIRSYIGTFKEENVIESPKDYGEKEKRERIEISEKEFELLKMLYAKDVDVETATSLLNVTEKQLNFMVRRLLTLEMLHYTSSDEVTLTDIGMNHLGEKNKI